MKAELKVNVRIICWSASKIRDAVITNYGLSHQRALMIARTERQLAQVRRALEAGKTPGVIKSPSVEERALLFTYNFRVNDD